MYWRLGWIGFLSGVLFAPLSPALAQRHWYVAPMGTNTANDCQNPSSPCATIRYALEQAATNTALPGDTLHVAAGVYTEAGLAVGRDLIWQGAGAETSIIQAATSPDFATDRVLVVSNSATLRLEGFTIRHGRTADGMDGAGLAGPGGNGGGILVNGTLELIRCHVISNRTGRGGAGGEGGSGGDGGGIYCDGSLMLSNAIVAFNRTGDGGTGTNNGGRAGNGWGIHVSGALTLFASSVYGNIGGNGGNGYQDGGAAGHGAVWNSGGVTMWNSTIAENTGGAGGTGNIGADGPGSQGGIWNDAVGVVTLRHVTVAANTSVTAPGLYNLSGGTLALDHALIAGVSSGSLELIGPCFLESTNQTTLTGDVVHLISGVDPQLGSLAWQGGDTPVCRLKPLSVAVDAGLEGITNAPAVDQRGYPRIQGSRRDLGAYELQSGVLYVAGWGEDGTNECRASDAPCARVAHAIPQALPGDVLQIATGIVSEAGVVLDRPLTIQGASATTTIWQAHTDPDLATNRILYIPSTVTATVRDLTFRHGHAPDAADADEGASGGALFNEGDLVVERCVFVSNRAGNGGPAGGAGGRGGALYNNGPLRVAHCRFMSNSAGSGGTGAPGGGGGAIYNDSFLAVSDTELSANLAGAGGLGGEGGAGGALFNAGLALLNASTLYGNRAGSHGGAIYNEDTLAGTNLTISANQTGPGGRGGGIANQGLISLHHATVAFNEAIAPGGAAGGLDAAGTSNVCGHVILSDNAADTGGPDGEGTLDSLGYNLIENSINLLISGVTNGNIVGVSALLEPIADNGGVTRTHGLALASPARESGDPAFVPPPAVDQRGQPRVIGPRIDIGSFEATLADSDGDGLPDYWETLFELDPHDPGVTNVQAGANGDPDHDRVENWSEYIAGTAPNDSQSVFRITFFNHTSNAVLRFPSRSDRLYSVQTAPLATSLVWTNLPGLIDVPGSGGTDTLVHANSEACAAYRVSVRLP